MEVTARKKIDGEDKIVTINYDFGEDLDEMVEKYGKDVVFSNARASFIITLQAAMRRYMTGGRSQEEISELLSGWKPGVSLTRRIDPVSALVSQWASFSPEKQKEILAKLKAGK
jgi:hypothetical protein